MQYLLILDKENIGLLGKIEIIQITVWIGIDEVQLIFARDARHLMDWRQRAEEMRKRRYFLVAAHLRENLFIVRRRSRVISDHCVIGRFIDRGKRLQIHIPVDDFPNDGLRRNMERDVAGVLGSIQHSVTNRIPLRAGKMVVLNGGVGFTAMCVEIFGLDAVCDLPVDCGRRPRLHIDGAKPLAGVVLIFRVFGPG